MLKELLTLLGEVKLVEVESELGELTLLFVIPVAELGELQDPIRQGVPVRALLPILPVLQHHHGGMPAEQVGSVCRLHRVAQRVGEPPNDGTAPP